MSLLLKKDAKFIGQGITGLEGRKALIHMVNYGTNIVAGVTPGKGGTKVEGVPIFNSVKEAVDKVGDVDGSVQFVPPLSAKDATEEAILAGVPFILVGPEKVPVRDASEMFSLAKKKKAHIVGPSSVGLISPHNNLKIGSIGGENPNRVFSEGHFAVLSKSGGMTSEISLLLKNAGLGISYAVGIGGDRIILSSYSEFLVDIEKDERTKATIIFGELGGGYEEEVAELISSGRIKKPVIAFIAGEFTMMLPSDVQFGHAGAILEGEVGSPKVKRNLLKESGVLVAEDFGDILHYAKKVK